MIFTVMTIASKMHIFVPLRPASTSPFIINSINLKHLHSTKVSYRKTLHEYKVEETRKVRFFILHKYANFLGRYPEVLKKRFPAAIDMYRVFTAGVQEFFKDVKEYTKIVRILYKYQFNFTRLTRRELELYHQMPKDMRKVAPVLLFSVLPLVGNAIFPLIYYYPRQFLTSHFWNIQQKSEFKTINLKSRLKHNRPVFRSLQEQLDFLKDHQLHDKWTVVLGKLGSGVQPTVEQILECERLFYGEPYNLKYLRPGHLRHLLRVHDMHIGWLRRYRLSERGLLLQEMDKAILREGGVHNLPLDVLTHACYIRGLNPVNMKQEEMISWLNNWIQISNQVNEGNISLLLHAPILLAYNEPSNWLIIYS